MAKNEAEGKVLEKVRDVEKEQGSFAEAGSDPPPHFGGRGSEVGGGAGMGTVLEDARETIRAISADLSAAPSDVRPNVLYGRVNPETGEVEWHRRSRRVRRRSGRPFYSMSLSVAPEDVPLTRELRRSHGVFAEFDADGCPKIESAVQNRKIAQALALFTGRDGYGHQSVSWETRAGRLEWPHKAQGGKARE